MEMFSTVGSSHDSPCPLSVAQNGEQIHRPESSPAQEQV